MKSVSFSITIALLPGVDNTETEQHKECRVDSSGEQMLTDMCMIKKMRGVGRWSRGMTHFNQSFPLLLTSVLYITGLITTTTTTITTTTSSYAEF